MALLDKKAFLMADDLGFEDVPVPKLGGDVRVRVMTGADRDTFRASLGASDGAIPVGKFSAALLVATCVNEDGSRMFDMEDMDVLQEKSAATLDTLASVAMRLNGLGGAAVEEAKNA